ncbi:MAG: riboflavin synthase [Candidatus Omnitrophica bacterium CG11_big_fil_rev_8_21_14_0_20_43_6]|nr:MAG: riboflavin synthase [Candidatus Omnitrophica bacterium CG11_big_fil_rev_8_21_14_0_20_43_6]
MFTGIVEETGKVKKITQQAGLTRLEVSAKKVLSDTKIGDSIAVNGVCLTAVAITDNSLSFEVMLATLKNTNLGLLKLGQAVNLERSLKVGDRVSGHFVSGHIDCLGLVRRRLLRNGSAEFQIAVEPALMRYCLPKGAVSINGISLTIFSVCGNVFTVCIIPHTLKNTTLSFTNPSDNLNVEFDILTKRAGV